MGDAAYQREWRRRKPDLARASYKKNAWRGVAWRLANPGKDAESKRRYHLKRNYALTPEDF